MSRKGGEALGDALSCAAVFAAALIFYAITLPRSLLPGDAGELISASRTLSVAHPPGYPLYLMLGRIFSEAFALGSMALRYNLMSAVLGSAVAGLLYLLSRILGAGRWVAAPLALALATSEAWWLQSTGAEVYTLNAFFVAVLLIVAAKAARRGHRAHSGGSLHLGDGAHPGYRELLLLGLVGGLAVSHHLTLLYALFASTAVLLLSGTRPRPAEAMLFALFFLLGLSAWLYIPVRASLSPPLTWGDTHTVTGFISHVTARGYTWRLKPPEPGARLGDLFTYARLLVAQSGPWISGLAVLGVLASLRRWRIVAGVVLVCVLYGLHTAAYNIPDIDSHLFPALISVGALAALGTESLASRVRRAHRAARTALIIALWLLPAVNIFSVEPRRDEWFAHDYALAAIESARGGAKAPLIIGSGSALDFPVLYFSLVEGAPADMYVLGVSDPQHAGLPGAPRHVGELMEWALEERDPADVALIGPVPAVLAGRAIRICGMVYVPEERGRACEPPDPSAVRGSGGDPRDYNSRLLAGTCHLHAARWHLAEGDTAGARAWIRSAVESAPDDAGTHIYASRLLLETGSPGQAFAMAERAAEIDPDFFEAHDMLGNLHYLSGDMERAIAEYEKALRGNPNPAPACSNIANAYSRLGDHSSAMRYYREALRLDDSTVNAHIGMGISLARTGEPEPGIRHLRTARDLDPHSPHPYHAEAMVLMDLDRYEDAFAVIEEGLIMVPGDAGLLADMGLAWLRTGHPDSAAPYLERALEANPMLLTARGNLALAYERTGDTGRAREQYRIYMETAPPGPARERAGAALERLSE